MPTVLQEPPTLTSAQGRRSRSSWMYRVAVNVARLLSLIAIVAILGGGWYLAKRGFGRQWRSRVVEELHKQGVEASIGRLTLDPFRGLIANNVRIFDYKNREKTIALISEVSLDINYAALIHRQPFLNALDVRNAEITLPFKAAAGQAERAQLTDFRAHIYFPPEQIYVSQAEGNFCGIRISATGQLIKRANYKPSPPISEEEWQKRLSMVQRIVSELQKFNYPAAPPSLQIKFTGDIAEIENARVEATLRGDRLQRGNYEMRNLSAVAQWNNQRLDIAQCEWSDDLGSFTGRADWDRQRNLANFRMRSSLDLKKFLDAFGWGGPLADTRFQSAPSVEVSASVDFGANPVRPQLVGHAAFGQFAYKGVPFSDLIADFSWDGERTFLRGVRIRNQTGQLVAELFDAPGDFRLNVESTIVPSAARALASRDLAEFLSQWEWQRSPTIHVTIRGPDRHPENWRGEGTVAMNRTRFRGVSMNSASSRFHFADGALTFEDFRVTRDEGVGTGNFTYDFKKHEVRVSNIKSSLHPSEAIFWIDPKLWKTVSPYKFRRPPVVTANGLYQFRGGKNTHLEIKVEGNNGLDYEFLGKTLPLDRVSARLLITKDRLQIVDLDGALFSGSVLGNVNISLAKDNGRYHATLAVTNIDFPHLTGLYFSYYHYRNVRGQVSGTYEFDGFGSDTRKMYGTGNVAVTNGDVFAIPVLGPISEILNHILPGAGYSIARNAGAKFTIRDGIIHSDDFNVSGQLFSVLGHGDIYFLDDKLDLDVRISAKGPGIVLAPVYKLFEYKAEGNLKKPDWHPKRF
jgi:hypothetical protein